MFRSFLLTGASGFLGSYLVNELRIHGELDTLGRSSSNNIKCDLSAEIPLLTNNYDCIIHAAGKAHVVPKNSQEAEEFANVNHQGTKRLIDGVKASEHTPKSIILISTVAVYGREFGENIPESSECLPNTPYGISKLNAEKEVLSFGAEYNIDIIVLRLPLVIGKKPLGNFKDMIDAIVKRRFAIIGKGGAKRSMVFAQDIASFIPTLINKRGVFNLTDHHHPDFKSISETIQILYRCKPVLSIPYPLARILALIGDGIELTLKKKVPINTYRLNKMTQSLTFNDQEANNIGWNPHSVVNDFNKMMK